MYRQKFYLKKRNQNVFPPTTFEIPLTLWVYVTTTREKHHTCTKLQGKKRTFKLMGSTNSPTYTTRGSTVTWRVWLCQSVDYNRKKTEFKHVWLTSGYKKNSMWYKWECFFLFSQTLPVGFTYRIFFFLKFKVFCTFIIYNHL